MNLRAVRAIYKFEMARTGRTLAQSIVSPVISTSLYFVVFGAAMGSRITEIEGVAYGMFIVPGLIMLMLLTQSVANASFGIYFPKFTGTIYELLSAPISFYEIVIGYVGAAATKSIILGLIILATAGLFVELHVAHPFLFVSITLLVASFSACGGLALGCSVDQQHIGLMFSMVLTPMIFFGCTYYPWSALAKFPILQKVVLINPLAYASEGLRATLVPQFPHLSLPLILVALATFDVLLLVIGLRQFQKKAVT